MGDAVAAFARNVSVTRRKRRLQLGTSTLVLAAFGTRTDVHGWASHGFSCCGAEPCAAWVRLVARAALAAHVSPSIALVPSVWLWLVTATVEPPIGRFLGRGPKMQ